MTTNVQHDRQRRTLLVVLILNGLLFAGLGLGGLLADSSALLANALDNASDSVVYPASLAFIRSSITITSAPMPVTVPPTAVANR